MMQVIVEIIKKSASALVIAVQTGGASTEDLGNTVSEANRC